MFILHCERYGPEAVDRTLQDIRDDTRPFGGITVVFGGDYQQTLPVVVHGAREEIVNATLQSSHLWEHINILCLQKNMRLEQGTESEAYAQWLLDVGHGRAAAPPNPPSHLSNAVALPDNLICYQEDEMLHSIYSAFSHGTATTAPPPDYFRHRMLLAPHVDTVHSLNHTVLQPFPGDFYDLWSADSYTRDGVTVDDPLNLPVEFLHSLNASGLPLAHLQLKIGCPIIILRNLAQRLGLCNGSRATVLQISNRVLQVRLMGGEHDGEVAFIPRITLSPSDKDTNFGIKLKRRQFPVQLAFALTINKAQGQSVKYVGVDLRTPVFGHGQLYVALSRATSTQHIKLLLSQDTPISGTPNVVYPEVLID